MRKILLLSALCLVMDGIKQTVESAGLSMDGVVSMKVFCTDLKY
jgi:enamine deaminase RidA (YjgF/YER057c/UK114 family)